MLMLRRKLDEQIIINGDIIIKICEIGEHGTWVKVGVDAPKHYPVDRDIVSEKTLKFLKDKKEGISEDTSKRY